LTPDPAAALEEDQLADYGSFARFYDVLMDDPGPRSARLGDAIDRYLPAAKSVLELGCGTGAVLAGLPERLTLTGLDRSPEMLAVAKTKVPRAEFVEGDMSAFHLGRRFDVVACVFDTINHLPRFGLWEGLFRRVHEHLNERGLFLFDVNTIGRLRRLSEGPPWVHHFAGNALIMGVTMSAGHVATFDIEVFEHVAGNEFTLHRERIHELGVELEAIRSSLDGPFALLEEEDPDGRVPTDDSSRAYFVARRR
jgi:SAM-dependent methyltransferase